MPQQPDAEGRIVVSKNINFDEWQRTVKNCKSLPGKVTLDKYVESAIKEKNDRLENESPDMEIKGRSKMKELAEDFERLFDDFNGQKEYTASLERLVILKDEELNVLKKVEKKVL